MVAREEEEEGRGGELMKGGRASGRALRSTTRHVSAASAIPLWEGRTCGHAPLRSKVVRTGGPPKSNLRWC